MTRNIVLALVAILAGVTAVVKLASVLSALCFDTRDLCAISEGDCYGD